MQIVAVAPHPDDETLGCGGTLLRYKAEGHNIYWIIVTEAGSEFSDDFKVSREEQIQQISRKYGFDDVIRLGFSSAQLDSMPLNQLISSFKNVFVDINPEIIFLPFPGDVHSDHNITFNAAISATKSFRQHSLKKTLCYETLSETDYNINPNHAVFRPNVYINIDKYIDEKMNIMRLYESEIKDPPFPRSLAALEAKARLRGSECHLHYAESFMLLKEIID